MPATMECERKKSLEPRLRTLLLLGAHRLSNRRRGDLVRQPIAELFLALAVRPRLAHVTIWFKHTQIPG